MRQLLTAGWVVLIGLGLVTVVGADEPKRDTAAYVDDVDDPVIAEMEAANEAKVEAAKVKTEELLAAYREAEKARDEPEQRLRFDLAGLVKPESPEAFTTRIWHFPPTPQYKTGTCWSFSATSFVESEIKRLHGDEIKLSEMWTAYWEFVEKVRGNVASRGESLYDHGSEDAAMLRVFRQHGVVPRSAYEGVLASDGRFDHDLMVDQIQSLLGWCKANNFWDEDVVIAMVRELLDATMGRPPEIVEWNGVEMTPQAFLADVCRIDPDDYVSLISTLRDPFWSSRRVPGPRQLVARRELRQRAARRLVRHHRPRHLSRPRPGARRRRLGARHERLRGRGGGADLRHPGRAHRPERTRAADRQRNHDR